MYVNNYLQEALELRIESFTNKGWKLVEKTEQRTYFKINLERRRGLNKFFYELTLSLFEIAPSFLKKPLNFIAKHIPKETKQINLKKIDLVGQIVLFPGNPSQPVNPEFDNQPDNFKIKIDNKELFDYLDAPSTNKNFCNLKSNLNSSPSNTKCPSSTPPFIHPSQPLQAPIDPFIKASSDAFQFERVDETTIQGLKLVSTNPKHGILNLEELKKDGLSPNNKLTVDNVTYYCTQPFKLGKNHVAVIGLVELEVQKGQKQVFPRLFYLSNSQGTWRTMPGALKMGQELKHYHKGIAESDTQLPMALNIALLKLPLAEPKASPMHINAGDLVKTYNLMHLSYDVRIQELGLIDQQFEDVHGSQSLKSNQLARPKAVLMPSLPKQPNFAKPIKEEEITLPLYGKVIARVYLSNDKSLQYLFYETQEEQQPGKVFLASVEDLEIKIGRYGVREVGFKANHMDSPLLEYRQQIHPDYRPNSDRPPIQDYHYDWNWDYIRELPIIQTYYTARGQIIPSGYIVECILKC